MRKPRYLQIGADYHVTAQINRGEYALESKVIKEMFLRIVKRAKKKYSFKLKNFVLMDTHIHLLIKPGKSENLSKIMQWILSVFASCYNKNISDVRLLLISDRLTNSGRAKLSEGLKFDKQGFTEVYYLSYPETVIKLSNC